MSSEWRKITFGDFVTIQRGHDLPDQDRRPGPVPILGSFGITGYHDTVKAKGPGVTIGRSGASFGVAAYSEQDFWPLNTALYVTDFKGNYPKFVFYFMKAFDFSGFNSGSAQPSLNRNNLYPVSICVPLLKEQRAIAALLGALDDRIALLRETNETLESASEALFKSWFIDFDPVHNKAKGVALDGMGAATAALFPSRFEETELGFIPIGWNVRSVYDIARVIYGAPFASRSFNSEGVGAPLVRIRDLRHENPIVFTDEIHPNGYMIQPGDLVVGMDGEFRAYLWGGRPAWLNQRVCVFAPAPGVPSAFVHRSIVPLLAAVEASETATTVIHLGKNDIDRFRVIVPNQAILNDFAAIVEPIYARIVKNKQIACCLSALRDILLPRLISGRLRLSEAETVIENTLSEAI